MIDLHGFVVIKCGCVCVHVYVGACSSDWPYV